MKRHFRMLLLLLFTVPALLAQTKTDANIVGHVICDCEHTPFATIGIKGTTLGVSTDETGHYMLVNLPVGTHILRAQSVGFKPMEKKLLLRQAKRSKSILLSKRIF